MNIFIYSDESGVFDRYHNTIFVFGGLILLSKQDKDVCSRKYLHAEQVIRKNHQFPPESEIKANTISNKEKGKLFRSLNQIEKFGIVVQQKNLVSQTFSNKKSKQRYLDWAYKYAVKAKLKNLISSGAIDPATVENMYFNVDEHTTATNGIYELRESLEQEFKIGIYNWEYNSFYPPLFPKLKSLMVNYCDSKSVTLVRAADIVANKLYYHALINDYSGLENRRFTIIEHPGGRHLIQ